MSGSARCLLRIRKHLLSLEKTFNLMKTELTFR